MTYYHENGITFRKKPEVIECKDCGNAIEDWQQSNCPLCTKREEEGKCEICENSFYDVQESGEWIDSDWHGNEICIQCKEEQTELIDNAGEHYDELEQFCNDYIF